MKPKPLAVRLWSHVDTSGGPDACWPWTGGQVHEHGYGTLRVGGYSKANPVKHKLYAHRLAWELTNGPIPAGLNVCHRCDNPPCCNPAHLFVGTQRENLQDASHKHRLPGPGTSGDHHHARQQTQCKHGHLFDEANTLWLKNGTRACRTCAKDRVQRFHELHPDAQSRYDRKHHSRPGGDGYERTQGVG